MRIGICGPVNPAALSEFLNCDSIPNVNGGASSVNTYVKELLRNGYKVIVFTSVVPSSAKHDRVLKGDRLEIHIVHSNPGVFLSHSLSRFYMVGRLKKYMQKYINKMDVLHAQWTYDFALAAKSFENQLPVFCTVRDWSPYMVTVQNGLKRVQWLFYNIMSKKVLNSKNIQFIANSYYTQTQILSAYPTKNVPIIFNSVDKTLIIEKKQLLTTYPSFISIAASASEKRKNIYTLLKAFLRFRIKHKDATLRLVGSGFTESNALMQEYKRKGMLEGVILCGFKNHTELMGEIDKVNCLVHPSIEETFGNILIEGMARGVVVIGGEKSGAVPQILGNGEYGILCDVTDEESLSNAMEKTLDSVFCKRMSEKALLYTKETFSSLAVMKEHVVLYERMLKEKQS